MLELWISPSAKQWVLIFRDLLFFGEEVGYQIKDSRFAILAICSLFDDPVAVFGVRRDTADD